MVSRQRVVHSSLASLVFTILFLAIFPFGGYAAVPEKITSHPALDYFPSLSKDGRYIAFVSERAGNPDIWLKSLSAGAISLPRQLTFHPGVDRDPAFFGE